MYGKGYFLEIPGNIWHKKESLGTKLSIKNCLPGTNLTPKDDYLEHNSAPKQMLAPISFCSI